MDTIHKEVATARNGARPVGRCRPPRYPNGWGGPWSAVSHMPLACTHGAATQWRDHEHGQGTHADDVGHHTGTYDMANDKRHRPRTSGTHGFDSRGYWLAHWPRWHDIVFHSRPRRRAEQ